MTRGQATAGDTRLWCRVPALKHHGDNQAADPPSACFTLRDVPLADAVEQDVRNRFARKINVGLAQQKAKPVLTVAGNPLPVQMARLRATGRAQ